MPEPLLLVMNPRRIAECVDAIAALDIDKVWMRNYTENELISVIPSIIAAYDHDPIGMIADDGTPDQAALDLVLEAYEPSAVYTGYCNMDQTTSLVNLCDKPLIIQDEATAGCYSPVERSIVEEYPDPLFPSFFAGFALTFMSRELWDRYPFHAYGHPGCQSDYQLCKRLQVDGVKIWGVRGAFFHHLKGGDTTTNHVPGGQVVAGNGQGSVEWNLRES